LGGRPHTQTLQVSKNKLCWAFFWPGAFILADLLPLSFIFSSVAKNKYSMVGHSFLATLEKN